MIPNLPPPSLVPSPEQTTSTDAPASGSDPALSGMPDFGRLLLQQMLGQASAEGASGESQAAEDADESQTAAGMDESAEIVCVATLLAVPLAVSSNAPIATNAVAAAPQMPSSSSAETSATARASDLISQIPDSFQDSPGQSPAPEIFLPSPRELPLHQETASHSEESAPSKADGFVAPSLGHLPETSPRLLAATRSTADPVATPMATALAAAPLLPPQVAQIANVVERINSPVGAREWQGELSQKVTWMVADRQQVAELHLNPPDLGPLQVVLSVSEGEASALFVSHHAAVREAIDSALPRLREMMAQNGVNLGSVTVSADAFPQQSGSPYERRAPAWEGADLVPDQPEAAFLPVRRAGSGLVDTFA